MPCPRAAGVTDVALAWLLQLFWARQPLPRRQDVVQGVCPRGGFRHGGGRSQGREPGAKDGLAPRGTPRSRPTASSEPLASGLVTRAPCEPPAPRGCFWGSLGAHLADGVEGPHVLQPAVRQPVGDFGAVQQPLAASEVAVLAQHPAFGKTLVSPGTPRSPPCGARGERGRGSLTSRP